MTTNKQSKHHKQQMEYFEDEFSRFADYNLSPWQQAYIDRINKYITKRRYNNKTLLDIAAGTGYVSVEMAKQGMNVVATDLSPTAIKHMNQYKKAMKLKNVKVIKCYAEDIPMEDNSVDVIVANAILEHIPKERETIDEWNRVLKPGGYILITVPLKYRYLWPFFWPVNYIHDKRIGHLRRYDKDELLNKFRMKYVAHFYTGHILKVLVAILSFGMDVSRYQQKIEDIDKEHEHLRYGASNIAVIMQKSK